VKFKVHYASSRNISFRGSFEYDEDVSVEGLELWAIEDMLYTEYAEPLLYDLVDVWVEVEPDQDFTTGHRDSP